MGFHRTGVVPIKEIKCSCGHEIKGHVTSCPHCGKTLIPTHLQTAPEDSTTDTKEDESKVK